MPVTRRAMVALDGTPEVALSEPAEVRVAGGQTLIRARSGDFETGQLLVRLSADDPR